jgi:hypothetical protein
VASLRGDEADRHAVGQDRLLGHSYPEDTAMPQQTDQPNTQFRFLPEFSECIAEAANNWSYLEYFISASIWELADVRPAIGACMTQQIFTLHARIDALLAMLKLRRADQKIIDRVNRFQSKIREAQEARNRLVHDLWLNDNLNPTNMGKLRITASKILEFSFSSKTITELKRDVEIIIQARKSAQQLRADIFKSLSSLPEIPDVELNPIVETL